MIEKLDLITIGESLIELSTDSRLGDADTLNKYYGGDTLATAVAAHRMGAKVGYITKVGDDFFRDYLLESWQNEEHNQLYHRGRETYNGGPCQIL